MPPFGLIKLVNVVGVLLLHIVWSLPIEPGDKVQATFTARELAVLVPQLLPAVTLIFPSCPIVPVVIVMVVVPVPAVIVHPVGTVHE